MIKFWKSTAKGKSIFPVRPPETDKEHNVRHKSIVLETILENENEGDIINFYEKKSKLSPKLQDVLNNINSLNHLIQFMQSIGKLTVLKCWLELEKFRKSVVDSKHPSAISKQIKLYRTKSFDLDWSSKTASCVDTQNRATANDNYTKPLKTNDSSTNSCHNLADDKKELEITPTEFFTNLTEEAINIFKKYIALEAPNKLELTDETRKLVISNICQPKGEINEDCFKSVQDLLFKLMETYFEEFQKSSFYSKTQLDVLTSGNLTLSDIIHNEALLFYFTEYLEQESASILLEYLMAVMHFRENLLNSSKPEPDQAQQDAIVIYEKYFSLQATSPVGFPTEVRLKVESEICREDGPLYSCFDEPSQIIFKTLNQHMRTFLESDVYFKYLSEMINSVDQMQSHHRSQSDCSSEFSISTQNTLLAMGDPSYHRKKRNHSVPDMTIDSNQLYNADSLWQRKRHDGLSLGRVNSLGRFESKFEPDPDKSERSVLKKMVSRFVSSSSHKVEEEMAWQIAHMIVKDVTDLTMSPPDNEHED